VKHRLENLRIGGSADLRICVLNQIPKFSDPQML
jgi:hypothetical protein